VTRGAEITLRLRHGRKTDSWPRKLSGSARALASTVSGPRGCRFKSYLPDWSSQQVKASGRKPFPLVSHWSRISVWWRPRTGHRGAADTEHGSHGQGGQTALLALLSVSV